MKRTLVLSSLLLAITFSHPASSVTLSPEKPQLRVGTMELGAVRRDLLLHLRLWSLRKKITVRPETLLELEKQISRIGILSNESQETAVSVTPSATGPVVSVNETLFGAEPASPATYELMLFRALMESAPPTSENERLEEDYEEQLNHERVWLNFRGRARRMALSLSSYLDELKKTESTVISTSLREFERESASCLKKKKANLCEPLQQKFGETYSVMNAMYAEQLVQLKELQSRIDLYRSQLLASVPGTDSRWVDGALKPLITSYHETKALTDAREAKTLDLAHTYPELTKCYFPEKRVSAKKKPHQEVVCLLAWSKRTPIALSEAITQDQAAAKAALSDYLTKIQERIAQP